MPEQTPNYDAYLSHALELNDEELKLREQHLQDVPNEIIDAHVHTGPKEFFNNTEVPPHVRQHMMSTYPTMSVEQSNEVVI